MPRRVLIMGAAGRDFHNFNAVFREDRTVDVVAFTATQIPFIDDRRYPASLAGPGYPEGIAIHDESELTDLIRDLRVDDVVFSYSDVSHEYVMHRASEVMAAGANFILLGPDATMLQPAVPTVAITAVRTGVGKSQTTRAIAQTLKDAGKRVAAVRHPMPYGNLEAQRVQRYAELADLDRYECTIEEREEYEPHITSGTVIYAGVDYGDILAQAQAECDVLLWDGGNNDLPFYRPTVWIALVDPLRAGHELTYHPGETNLRAADVILINKMDSATPEQIARLEADDRVDEPTGHRGPRGFPGLGRRRRRHRRQARAGRRGRSDPDPRRDEDRCGGGRRATVRCRRDRRSPAVGDGVDRRHLREVRRRRRPPGHGLQRRPALGDGEDHRCRRRRSGRSIGTPIDLRRVITIDKPAVRVRYDLDVLPDSPQLVDILAPVL